MDVTLLAAILWATAATGVVAVVGAVLRPAMRRLLLVVAAILFLPIGILGILSVGVLFLVAAVACLIVAAMQPRRGSHGTPSS